MHSTMMKDKSIEAYFRDLNYSKGITKKHFSDNDAKVVLEGKILYYGPSTNFRLKMKEVVKLNIRDDSIEIQTADLQLLLLDPIGDVTKFCQRLEYLREKHGVVPEHSTKSFIKASSSRALGSPRKKTIQRRTYGHKTIKTNIRTDFDWSDDEKETELPEEKMDVDDSDTEQQPLDEEDQDDEQPVIQPPPKTKRGRLKKFGKVIEDDDTDDDDIFTTPEAKHLVSPSKTTAKKDEQELENVPTQPKLSSFFQPRKQTFDPSKDTAPTTPLRQRKPTTPTLTRSALQSPFAASVVKNSKRKLQSNEQWLEESRTAQSPSKQSAQRIYGTNSPFRKPPTDPFAIFDKVEPRTNSPSKTIRKRPRPYKPLEYTPTRILPKATTLVLPEQPSVQTPIERNPFRGLRNLGNTCYMNASLQMLYSIPSYVNSLVGRGGILTKSVLNVYNELQDETGNSPVVPRDVKSAIDTKTDKFRGYEQRDAHEFINDLLDHIHEESKADESSQPEPDDFSMTLQVCLECTKCGYSRTKNEMYRNLSIDIVGDDENHLSKIEDCLAKFFRPEEREIKCEKCEDGNCAKQTTKVLHRPKALLLHLKRFIFVEKPIEGLNNENASPNSDNKQRQVEYVFKKNKSPVELPEELSLSEYTDKASDSASTEKYKLKSIVYHIGRRASSGHYTADVIRKCKKEIRDEETGEVQVLDELEDRWVTFDDTNSAKVSWERVSKKRENAYLVLYALP